MQYVTVESDLPFRAEVVWSAITNPSSYNLWLEGLVEVEPSTPLRRGDDLTLTMRTGPKGLSRTLTFDVTTLRPPSETEGLVAFEGRLKPEGLVLGSIRVTPAHETSRVTVSLEIAQGPILLALFERPFGIPVASKEDALRAVFQRALVAFEKALDALARDPYRGRA